MQPEARGGLARPVLLLAAAAAPSVALGAWFGSPGGSPGARALAAEASLVLAPLVAAAACVVRARRSPQGAPRLAWHLLATGAGMWAAASVIFSWFVVVLQRAPSFPSAADALYLGFALPVVAAIVAFTWSSARVASRARTLLDGLVIAASLLFVSWGTVLGPVYRAPMGGLAHAAAVAYPVVDVTVAALVLALGIRRDSRERASLGLVTLGLLAVAFSDTVYVRANLAGTLQIGVGAWQAGYLLGFLLVAAGALTPATTRPASTRLPGMLSELATYAPLLLAGVVAVRMDHSLADDTVFAVSGMVVVGLAVVRQVLVLADNARLRGDLVRMVELRTSELSNRTRELELSQSRLRAITQTAADAIVVMDGEGIVRDWNLGAEAVFGRSEREAVGREMSDFMPERYRAAHRRGLHRQGEGATIGLGPVIEVAGLRADGTEVPLELSVSKLVHDGQPLFTGILRDITARRIAEQAADRERASVALMERVAATANQSVDMDTALEEVLGLVVAHGRWSIGHAFLADPDGALASGPWHLTDPVRFGDFVVQSEAMHFVPGYGMPGTVLATGEPRWIDMVATDPTFPRSVPAGEAGLVTGCAFPIMSRSEVVGVLEFFSETEVRSEPELLDLMRHIGTQLGRVIERARADRRLTDLALHDPLTGLANRRLFADRVDVSLRSSARTGRLTGVVLIDLDGFKAVNDSLGHLVGDELLRQVGRLLTAVTRSSDTVARLGGDEFALVLGDLGDVRDAEVQAERLLAALAQPVQLGDRALSVAGSIGIAVSDDASDSASDLLRNADIAMYSAKAAGKGRFATFAPEMHSNVLDRLELEVDLRRALAHDEMSLHYQPILDARTGAVRGREALLRWAHPTRGAVSPAEFLPVAEACGLIQGLGAWVLSRACADAAAWRAAGEPEVTVSVNLSPAEVSPTLVDRVLGALHAARLPADALLLEITESLLMEVEPSATSCLLELHSHGIGLSVDDFGTGHSSLGRLRSLPVEEFKIDRSFVADLDRDPAAAAMVEAIISMAAALGRRVVAEGVETPAQLRILADHGCDLVQGFLLGRPAALPAGPATVDPALFPARPEDAGTDEAPLPADRSGSAGFVRGLLHRLTEATGLESTYLTRIHWDRRVQEISVSHNAGSLDIAEGLTVDWPDTLCRQALLGGPAATSDARDTYGPNLASDELGIRSYVGVPVLGSGGEVVGTLCGVSAREVRSIDATLPLMELFARLIADRVTDSDWPEPASLTPLATR